MSNLQLLAKNICQILFDEGYVAYFAGGWVRDLLMGQPTHEIDIATSAPPFVIQRLFPKTVPVGISFGVVIVVLDGINFEVTTFRKDHSYVDGRHPEGVDFSTPEKDAERRDFTINGMFFDPLTEIIYDYVNGQEDLKKKVIRAIGDPSERFSEDRLRMVRAVRFAARLGFSIEKSTASALTRYASSLFPSVSMERIWQELCKMASHAHFDQALLMLHQFGLLKIIFPQLSDWAKEAVEKKVAPFPYFPLRCPAMAYLLELFPNANLEERLALCKYLKTSLQEQRLVEFFTHAEALFRQPQVEAADWAHFYAHPLSELFVNITAAKILSPKRTFFVEEHQRRKKFLSKHVERIKEKKPLITAAHLQKLGVSPGKQMGELLKKAEKIAINHDLDFPEPVIKILTAEIAERKKEE